jgi:hypothetical protein
MSKEIFIAAHDQLIEEYFEQHPDATEREASEATEGKIQDRYGDMIGDMIDAARDRAKYEAVYVRLIL